MRLLLPLLALPLRWFGGRALMYALVSDETRIAWHVESMRDGYNSGDIGDAVGPLHADWRHAGYEMDRELVRAGLVREFFQEQDSETKKLLRRVDLDEDALEIEVDEDAATLTTEVWFSRRKGDAWTEAWRARIDAELVRTEDGWKILASRHEDVRGTQLSR